MARNGFKILDSDMHVFEPHDLYLKIHESKMGRSHTAGRAAQEARTNQIHFGQRQAAAAFGNPGACSHFAETRRGRNFARRG